MMDHRNIIFLTLLAALLQSIRSINGHQIHFDDHDGNSRQHYTNRRQQNYETPATKWAVRNSTLGKELGGWKAYCESDWECNSGTCCRYIGNSGCCGWNQNFQCCRDGQYCCERGTSCCRNKCCIDGLTYCASSGLCLPNASFRLDPQIASIAGIAASVLSLWYLSAGNIW